MDLELTLKVAHSIITPASPNFSLPCWPPPEDFPIVVDRHGDVVSRFADPIWDLSAYAGESTVLNFGDGSKLYSSPAIDKGNAKLLRIVMAWHMFGDRPTISVGTLRNRFAWLRPIFVHCSQQGIAASALATFPKVAKDLVHVCTASPERTLRLLHDLWLARDAIGFELLDREGLRHLAASISIGARRQTPFIPPRIWLHQILQLRAFLDEFHQNVDAISSLYRHCLEVSAAQMKGAAPEIGASEDGWFSEAACQFGVAELLQRSCVRSGEKLPGKVQQRMLSSYLSQVCFVGMAYLINFTGMRRKEFRSLRADCLEIEHDPRFGDIYLLRGCTTKTIVDDDALWVTSPTARLGVEAMANVSRLRLEAAACYPGVRIHEHDFANPRLIVRAYDPWLGTGRKHVHRDSTILPHNRNYREWASCCPNLFDPEELRLRQDDLDVARLINPTLDQSKFYLGAEWPFSWHQLRRTTAVNMIASGIVSDASLQYQLKHLTRAMSLYYGQGYSQRNLNRAARQDYIRITYEMLGLQASELVNANFISLLGHQHKANVLNTIRNADLVTLERKAKVGQLHVRRTLLGVCLKKGACPYGGVESIVPCAGGPGHSACPNGLVDTRKREMFVALKGVTLDRLASAVEGTPLHESLTLQQKTLSEVINAIEINS